MKQASANNLEFITIKQEHKLSMSKIAGLMECSIETIKSYSCNPESTRYRDMPALKLKFFKMLVNQTA